MVTGNQHFIHEKYIVVFCAPTYERCNEQASSATLVGLPEASQLLQTKGLTVQSSATALRHAQRTVTVLNTTIVLPLIRDAEREPRVKGCGYLWNLVNRTVHKET